MTNASNTLDLSHGISGILPGRSKAEGEAHQAPGAPLPPCSYKRKVGTMADQHDPDEALLELLKPDISDPFSLAPMHYQVLLSEAQSLFVSLTDETGNRHFANAAELLGEELFMLNIISSHKQP